MEFSRVCGGQADNLFIFTVKYLISKAKVFFLGQYKV